MRYRFRPLCILLCFALLVGKSMAQITDLQGSWKAEFKDSSGSGTATLILAAADSQTIAGTYQTNLDAVGTVTITSDGNGFKFALTQTTQECRGSFTGEFGMSNGLITGTYSGTDCRGVHQNGAVSMTREKGRSAPAVLDQATKATEEQPAIVKEVPSDAEIKKPERIPVVASHVQQPKAIATDDYGLTIRVLQTEQVPYSVQYGGGGTSTNCSINGSTYTTGSATSIGNYTYGNAVSDTNLSMRCNTYENPPMRWRHVLNTMLVVGSNGNAYIIACDAAWRWSKCRGLVTGDTFRARMTSKGLAVQYLAGGKEKEGTYSILQGKVLTR